MSTTVDTFAGTVKYEDEDGGLGETVRSSPIRSVTRTGPDVTVSNNPRLFPHVFPKGDRSGRDSAKERREQLGC
jgi:hypothetical protein